MNVYAANDWPLDHGMVREGVVIMHERSHSLELMFCTLFQC
jgi:hypothetical protein